MELSRYEFSLLNHYILNLCGIAISEDKTYLIQQRLEPLAVDAGCKCFAELYQKLAQGPHLELRERVVNAITTNETSFFRDGHPFTTFKHYILPRLGKIVLDRKSGGFSEKESKVCLWSAGASTGQEPYSLAMLIHEYAEENRPSGISSEDFELLATDVSSETLSKAMSGVYSEMEVKRGLSPERLQAYFRRDGANWVIGRSIRNMVKYRQINLAKPFTVLGGFDMILCRNVLIYFDNTVKMSILKQFHNMLSKGGFLVLGAAEHLHGITDIFEPIPRGNTIIYQKPLKN